jgi:esterase/lipase
MNSFVPAIVALLLIILLGPRPKLIPRRPEVDVPTDLSLRELAAWLANKEAAVPELVDGADARIQFANPDAPAKTSLCFVYIHGFSATWPETAPVTERLAARFSANVLQARLTGHGTVSDDMVTPAEAWLESMAETLEIALQLGDKLVIVATSTGAPLSVWLASRRGVADKLHAMLFMSPNFKIRSRFDFLLTAQWSRHWIHWFVGRHREWEPINEAQAKYWTWRYSTLALIEMQKVVDWANHQRFEDFTVPLAIMYMRNDPTIDPEAAIAAFKRWGAADKALMPVTVDGDKPDHVFAGDIVGPHRTDWCVAQFAEFLERLPDTPH